MSDPRRSDRVAAIDCGTNSFRLLVAGPGPDGGLVELTRELRIVRLGQGVDATGELHPDALARTFAAAEAYAEELRAYGVAPERTRVVATSAARDARNRADFFAGMTARLGVVPEVITGTEEARLSFVRCAQRRPGGRRRPGAGDGHRRRLDRAGLGAKRRGPSRPRCRWTSGRSG